MEIVTFKIQENILKKVDSLLEQLNFNNRTEFLRAAVREKLEKIDDEIFIRKLKKYHGASKKKTTYAEEREAREEAGREIAKRFGIKLD